MIMVDGSNGRGTNTCERQAQNDMDALVYAVFSCPSECVRMLIEAGSKLDACDYVREMMLACVHTFFLCHDERV